MSRQGEVSELVSLVGADRVATLGTIFVVDAANAQEAVCAVVRTIDPTVSYTPNPGYSARGVAVPVEQDGQLVSTIVLSRELIELLAPPRIHPYETVSTVLEELLHVSVYETTWHRRGYVHHRGRGLSGCDADVLAVLSQMSDEYVVNRRKAMLASTRPQYRERVLEHWLALHRGLQRMFDGDLADTELLLPEMSEAVRQTLLRFGVDYQRSRSGSCSVHFSDPGGRGTIEPRVRPHHRPLTLNHRRVAHSRSRPNKTRRRRARARMYA